MEEGLRNDFPVISDHRVDARSSLADARPGELVLGDETLYEDLGSFEPGEENGIVTIEERKTPRPGRVLFTATFTFVDGDTVTLHGVVPGNGTWVGKGKGAYGGGTGKFGDRHGDVPVEGRNPKRWG